MNTQEITVARLQKMLEENTDVVVLDVRPQEQRREWKIAGSIHMDAYSSLISGNKNALDKISLEKEIPIVTVCAGGKVSLTAARILNKKGYRACSLHGGMKAWNYAWNTAEIKSENLILIQVRRVAKGCLSYIIASDDEAVVVDASLESSIYLGLAEKYGWTIKYVLDTHIHADYLSRTIELAKATGAMHLFAENAVVNYDFTPLRDGEIVPFGSANLKAVFTPGHTPESISYLINNDYLLTGDTLFTEGVGRPDLKADYEQGLRKAEQLFNSLAKILTLSNNDLIILPAHTSGSIAFDGKAIGDKLSGVFAKIELLQLGKEAFIEQTMKRILPTPPNYMQIATLNKIGSFEGINPADVEAGANRCAVS